MNVNVVKSELVGGEVSITGVSSSSLFLIGDANYISLSSTFDTPAESLIIGPYVPLSLS
ncbi:spore gernimation protein GerPD [Bacillus megaterium]|nr:spore gernimation protein GerPD [Priestia megaterium]